MGQRKEKETTLEVNKLNEFNSKSNYMLGKKLYELKKINKDIKFEDYNISSSKGIQLIKNYLFYEEYELSEKDFKYSHITQLSKIKNIEDKFKEHGGKDKFFEKIKGMTLKDLKLFLKNKKFKQYKTKTFNIDESDGINFKTAKEMLEKEMNEKITDNMAFKYLLMYYITRN